MLILQLFCNMVYSLYYDVHRPFPSNPSKVLLFSLHSIGFTIKFIFSYRSLNQSPDLPRSGNIIQRMTQMAMVQRKGSVQAAESKKSIDIAFTGISYFVEVERKKEGPSLPCRKEYDQKQLLKNVSGIFKAGQVTAIMGASGAGKTTLLNVLACRVPSKQLEGKICANGIEYNFQNFGDFANYVMQTDVLMQTLTVRETLEFAANLKLNLSEEQKHERISLLCKKLKLQKCLDVIVGGVIIKGISGGQRKRTSIAFELISDPQVLMLDEPTSGLDSLTSFIIVRYLKSLAVKLNKTIFMTIHQPNTEIYNIFDRLMLLVDGRLIYQGPKDEATGYFSRNFKLTCPQFSNPADYFMSIMHHEDTENRNRYPEYFRCYDEQIKPQIEKEMGEISKEEIEKRIVEVPFSMSFGTLVKRDFKNVIRNPMLIRLRIVQTIFMGIYAGGLYCKFSGNYTNVTNWQALTGFFFFLSINMMMLALAPVQLVFPSQRGVFLKEEGAKLYTVTSYFLSRNIIQIPYSIVFPLLQSLIMYWFVGLNSTPEQFFTFYLICYLISFAGMSLGLLLGSMVTDEKSVSALTPMVLLPFFLFSGLFKNTGNLSDWIGWIQYISPVKYSFSGFLQNEVLYAAKSNVAQMNFDVGLWASVGALAGLGIGYRLLSLFFLWLLRARLQ